MGEVFIAFDEQLHREVAVKLMRATEDSDERRFEQFEREAQIIARLQHPNIVQVYDYGVAQGETPYIVMELLDGEDLARMLKRAPTLPLRALVPWMVQAAKGLHAAHRAGIIHRDLKPANLFLTRHGGESTLKILDFGVATVHHGGSAIHVGGSRLIGTPSYMSPELAQGDAVDYRTDLWSLGIVAYQALTGNLPFTGANSLQVVMQIIHEPHLPPSQRAESLGPRVDAFFERALAKDPKARFSSALEFAASFSALEWPGESPATTVLVVDDEPDLEIMLRQRFRGLVRRSEYELLFARDGHSALDVLARRPDVDVVLTDLNMPGMDGLTLLGKLARVAPASRAVVLSAYNDMANIRAAMNAGAYDFLTKPIDFADLEATLRRAGRDARELRRALRSIEENDALRLFVDDALMDRLLPLLRVSNEVSGETIDATIVSIDVWGVGRQVEQGPAAVVFQLLNRTFDIVVPIVNTWKGVIVSFVGDAVLAVFQGEDHLFRASSACLSVRTAVSEATASERNRTEPYPGVCIGMDSGLVVSGSIGSRAIQRMHYSVLGRTVSRAIVLERLAERGQILVRQPLAVQLAPYFESRAVEGPAHPELGELCNLVTDKSDDDGKSNETRPVLLTDTVVPDPEE